ncbi:MAG TPA: hypothetical protein VLD67_10520, partial [Vicinamibacterales bacterium]|nr:hypothetical protein [Vicinamibacterales bacterium]
PLDMLISVDQAAWQELQRHRLPQLEVVGAVHLAHAASAEQRDNTVALADGRSGQEAAVLGIGP